MPATYEPIASQTLGSNSASYTFSNVPATYTDLVIVAFTRNSSSTVQGLRMRFNADSGSNYSTTFVFGDGSTAGSGRLPNNTDMAVGNAAGSAEAFAVSVIHVFSYANTNVFTTTLNAGATPASAVARNVSLWRNTSAVSSITFFATNAFDLQAGSTFSLYGIKAAA